MNTNIFLILTGNIFLAHLTHCKSMCLLESGQVRGIFEVGWVYAVSVNYGKIFVESRKCKAQGACPTQKVFEAGKIRTKKVKFRVKTLHLTVGLLHFHFFGRDLPFSNFLGGNSKKSTLYK